MNTLLGMWGGHGGCPTLDTAEGALPPEETRIPSLSLCKPLVYVTVARCCTVWVGWWLSNA